METITIRQRGLAPVVFGTILVVGSIFLTRAAGWIGLLVGAVGLLILLGRVVFRLDGMSEASVWWTLAGVPLKKLRSVPPASVREVVLTRTERRNTKGRVERIHLVSLEGAAPLPLWDEGSYEASKRLAEAVARAIHRPFRDEAAAPPPLADAAAESRRARASRTVGAVVLVIGVAALGLAGWLATGTLAFTRSAERAPGEVVELVPSRGSKGGTVHAPVVRWQADGEAEPRLLHGTTSSSPPAFEVGERVTVLHPPGRPDEARLDAFSELWIGATIAGGVGAVLILVGAANLAFRRVR